MKYNFISNTIFSKLIAVAFFLGGLFGCNDDFLEEKPLDFLSSENAYSEASGIKLGINGLHSYLRDVLYYGDDAIVYFYSSMADVSYNGENPGGVTYEVLTPSNNLFYKLWQNMYILISRSNELLLYIDGEETTGWDSPEQRALYKGEVLFFRAYAYRLLTSFYGDVPLLVDAVTVPKTEFVRTPLKDVYAQVESDLLFATQHLPDPGKEEEKGRVTKGAAYPLLSEVYLQESKYKEAVEAATHVIDDFGYRLMTERFGATTDVFKTGDVFLDLFAYGNQNLSENKEAIWVAQFAANLSGGGGTGNGPQGSNVSGGGGQNNGPRRHGPRYYSLGNDPAGYACILGEFIDGKYTGYSDTLSRPVSWSRPTYHVTHEVWASDWDNDIRNAPHNIKRTYYFQNPESPYNGQVIDFSLWGSYETNGRNPMKDTCNFIYPYWIGKVGDPCHIQAEPLRSGGGYTWKDCYFMRLAETYLNRAEAYIQLGEMQKAADDINVVRSRAHAKPVATSDVSIDYLLDERIRELYTEEMRDVVLRRTGKFLECLRKYNDNPQAPGMTVKDHNILWPIPQTEIDATGGTLTQNPGYN